MTRIFSLFAKLSPVWRWFLSFALWYWRRVKEIPLVVGSFALGGFYVGVLLTSERLLAVAAQRFL